MLGSSDRRLYGVKLQPVSFMFHMQILSSAKLVVTVLCTSSVLIFLLKELGKAEECMAKALAETFGTDEKTIQRAKMAAATMYMGMHCPYHVSICL